MKARDFLDAARVPITLKPQSFGLWSIQRVAGLPAGVLGMNGWNSQTILRRMTLATMRLDGDIVMEDSHVELCRHLPIWMVARGRILITGLGLGCVVRGLLASPDVEHVDVVEIDKDIIRVCGREFRSNRRVTIHRGDALKFEWPAGTKWDYAWHDLWTEQRGGALQHMHVQLISKFWHRTKRQGAWAFPKDIKGNYILDSLASLADN